MLFKEAREFTAEIIKLPSNSQIRAKSFISQRMGAKKASTSSTFIKKAKSKFEIGVINEISLNIKAVMGRVNKNEKKDIQRETETA